MSSILTHYKLYESSNRAQGFLPSRAYAWATRTSHQALLNFCTHICNGWERRNLPEWSFVPLLILGPWMVFYLTKIQHERISLTKQLRVFVNQLNCGIRERSQRLGKSSRKKEPFP